MIKVDLSHTVTPIPLEAYIQDVKSIDKKIKERTGLGGDFLGWTTWFKDYDKEEFERIIKAAEEIQEKYEVLVVAGIGGSYLGARCAIEALNGLFPTNKVKVIFVGNTLSSSYVAQVLEYLKDKKFAINVISKSGTTTETSISFRLLKELLISKVGEEEANKAIFATTDKKRGALKQEADAKGYQTFVIPDDIGGRYSVFTAVGLLPIAVAGLDIRKFMQGGYDAMVELDNPDVLSNEAYKYAVARHYLYNNNKSVEMFITYELQLAQLGEWFKQLFGESEGKDHKGILPDSATFSTDLHSLGQFIQEGSPILFETILNVEEPQNDVTITKDDNDLDGLNYLSGKKLSYVNKKAFEGTLAAHEVDGNIPNIIINLPKMDEYNLGYLFFFFMKACAMSAYLIDINPFNQPGVEIYKKRMFKLLGKPQAK
ncbi:MAG: glucose-6-phosphate isomerase [Bacilli bacterium]|nr:glucose-6-phosphate isomerase [Bacilli bacterium]